jgi:hypothetical protein
MSSSNFTTLVDQTIPLLRTDRRQPSVLPSPLLHVNCLWFYLNCVNPVFRSPLLVHLKNCPAGKATFRFKHCLSRAWPLVGACSTPDLIDLPTLLELGRCL